MSVLAPPRRLPRRLPRLPADAPIVPAGLALIIAIVGVLLTHYGMRLWIHGLDEDLYRRVGEIAVTKFPEGLWDTTIANRGSQRLEAWLIGFPLAVFGSPTGFRVVRILNIAAYCSTAIVVVRWTRALGLKPWLQLAAGALSILTPWALITSSFLTENVAYPATAWALYAIWRVAVAPGFKTLGWALLAIVIAMLARSASIALVPILAAAVVLVAARYRTGAVWAARRTLTPRQVLPWLVAAGLFGIAAFLYAFHRETLHPILGLYTKQGLADRTVFLNQLKRTVALGVSGTGVLPGVLALAWVARGLVKPTRPEDFALALLAVAVVLFAAYGASQGGPDERYIMYPAPLVAVAAAVAIGRREVGIVLSAAAALFVWWVWSKVTWNADQAPFGYFAAAAETFHARVMLLGFGSRTHLGWAYPTILGIGVVAGALVAGFAIRRGTGRVALVLAAGLGLLVLCTQYVQLRYVSQHFTKYAMWGPKTLEGHAWIDEALKGHGDAAFFMPPGVSTDGLTLNYHREAWFWNTKAPTAILVPGGVSYALSESEYRSADINPRTGRLVVLGEGPHAKLPSDLVEYTSAPVAPLVGNVVAQASYMPMQLVHVAQPVRVKWWVGSIAQDAFTLPDTPAYVRVYRPSAGNCLDLDLVANAYLKKPTVVTLRSGHAVRRLKFSAGHTGRVRGFRLTPRDAQAFEEVVVTSSRSTMMPDRGYPGGVRFAGVNVRRCT